MHKVIRITNPHWLAVPDVVALILRSPLPVPAPGFISHMMEITGNFNTGMFMVLNPAGRPVGYTVVFLPDSPLWDKPQVYMFFCDGGKAARNALISHGLAWVRENGYTQVMGFNMRGASGAAYQAAFAGAGRLEVVGTIVTFDTEQPANGKLRLRRR